MLSIARIRQNIDKTLLFLAATVAIALAIRVIYVSLAPHVDPVLAQNPLYGDAQGYHLLALNLLNGYGLSWDGQQPTSYRAPGYPAFLALMYCFTGSNLAIVRIIQAVLGALTCIPVFLLAKQLAGPATAAISGFAVAFHPLLVYMTAWLYPETLFILLLWLALWTFSHSVAPHTSWHALFSGGLLGLAALIRPEVVALPLFCAIPLLGFRKQRHLLRQLLIVEAIAILVVLPWSIRNMAVHRAFVLITTNTGSNLYGGNNPDADGGFTSDVPYILPRMTEVESDHELIQRAVQWIIHHPGDFISLLPQKFAKFFSPLAMGTSEDIHLSGNLVFWVNVLYTLYLLLALGGAILLGIYQSTSLVDRSYSVFHLHRPDLFWRNPIFPPHCAVFMHNCRVWAGLGSEPHHAHIPQLGQFRINRARRLSKRLTISKIAKRQQPTALPCLASAVVPRKEHRWNPLCI